MLNKPHIVEHIKHLVDFTVLDVKWVPDSANLCSFGAKDGRGIVNCYQMNEGKLDLVISIDKKKPVKCASFGLSKKQAAIGDIEGRLQILDFESPKIPLINTKAHKSSINSIDIVGGGQAIGALEIVTGSKDGSIKIWDLRQHEVPVVHLSPEQNSPTRDCWSVAFGGSQGEFERCVAAGFDNGDLKVFDLRALKPIYEDNLVQGVTSVQFDKKIRRLNKLVVSTVGDGLRVYDFSSELPSLLHQNQRLNPATVWATDHLPQDNTKFATIHGDGSFQLWSHNNFECLLQEEVLSSKPLITFDWNRDFRGLGVVGSLDNSIRVLIVNKF